MFVQVEMLLSFEQFWMLNPGVSCLNADLTTHIIYETYEIDSNDVSDLSVCPSSLLRWQNRSLDYVPFQVCMIDYK